MDPIDSNPAAHGCRLRHSGKPILPLELLRSKFARCVNYLLSHVRKSRALIATKYVRRVSNLGLVYYTRNSLVTRSDCSKPEILNALETAEAHVLECMTLAGVEPEHCDIVVDVYCVSTKSPRYNYYIADHRTRTVRWLCQEYPGLLNPGQTRVRDSAEYWRHRATFPDHRACTQAELQEAKRLLSIIKAGNLAPVFGADQLDRLVRSLDVLGRTDGGLGAEATFSIARVNQAIAERSIPHYYNQTSSTDNVGRPGLLGALFGIWLPSKPRHARSPDIESEHQSQHSGSPRSSVHDSSRTRVGPSSASLRPESMKSTQSHRLGVTPQPPSPRDSVASRSSEYLTALSSSVNDLGPPPKIQFKSAGYSPTRPSPLTRNVEVFPAELTDTRREDKQENGL